MFENGVLQNQDQLPDFFADFFEKKIENLIANVKIFEGRLWTCVATKLMRIELSNREWPYLRLSTIVRLPTITVIVRYSIIINNLCSMHHE